MSDSPQSTNLIGRERELARLHELWDTAGQGQGETVFVTGEAGMGKSTLAEAFIAQLRTQRAESRKGKAPDLQIARGDCSQQFGREEAFLPFAEALADLLQAQAQDQTTARKVFNVVYDCAPAWMGIVPVVGDVLGGLMETAKAAREHFGGEGQDQVSEPDQNRMLQEYTNALLALAQRAPLLLFLDDLHWADAASVALLTQLARRIATHPILIIGTYRPSDLAVEGHPLTDARREMDRYKVCTEIELNTFDRAGFEALIARTLPNHDLPAAFVDRLYQQTDGVPLYAAETLSYLRDSDMVHQVDGQWRLASDDAEIELPTSVEAVIEKRLERLDEDRRRTLQYGSVEGDEFTSTVLAMLLDVDELELEEQLETVEKVHRLIRFDGEVELGDDLASRYEFSHALFQKILYDALRGKRLRLLHRRVGEALEELYGDEVDQVAHQLAYHFEVGYVLEKALAYSLQAARRSLDVYAWDEAELGFERAQRLAEHAEDPDAVEAQVQEGLGDIALARAQYDDAVAGYDAALDALDLALIDDEDEVRARLHRKHARAFEHLGDFEAAFAALDEGLQLAPDDSLEEAALHIMGAGLHHRQGRHRQALEWCEKALAVPGLPKVHPIRAHAERLVGVMHTYLGQPEDALKPLKLAMKIETRLENLPGQFDTCSNLGTAYFVRADPGDWQKSREYHERALGLAQRMNDSERLARANVNLGWLAYCLGDVERAIQTHLYSLDVWTQSGARLMCAIVRNNLGAFELVRGNQNAALEYLQDAAQVLEESNARGQLAETCRYLALAHLAAGNLADARQQADKALTLSSESEEQLGVAAAQRVLGRIALAAGDLERATNALDASKQTLETAGNRYELGQTLVVMADLHAQLGDATEAAAELNTAIEIFTDLDASRDLQAARRLQDSLMSPEGA